MEKVVLLTIVHNEFRFTLLLYRRDFLKCFAYQLPNDILFTQVGLVPDVAQVLRSCASPLLRFQTSRAGEQFKGVMDSQCLSNTIEPPDWWLNGGVKLHEDQERDADIGIEDAEEQSDSIEPLVEDDTPFDGRAYLGGYFVFQQPCTLCIPPTREEDASKQKQMKPVDTQSDAVGDKFGQESCRERQKRNSKQEDQMEPGEVTIAADQTVELCLLTDPENAEGEKAHDRGEKMRGQLA